jgi:hypothetical protein
MSIPSNKPRFLLLLRQPPGPPPPPEYLQPIMAKFMTWMQAMSAKGMVVATNGLEHTGKVLRGSRGASVTDGPYPESKEIVGGFVLLAADNLEQALDAARDCPGLEYQMVVEVRPVSH